MMKKAYSYIRFSSPEQAAGDSLRRQTEGAEKWCSERGIALDETLRDLGVSAYRGANRTEGALRSFLDLIERGDVEDGSYLIVESLDRLSREAVVDAVPRFLDIIRAGVTIVTLSDRQEYSYDKIRNDWTALIVSLAVMARAHEESKLKSERVAKAWQRKKDEARNERRPLTPRCPEWLEVRDGKFVKRADRVNVVKRIFQETIDGFGRREIMRRLNVEGVPTFRGGQGWQTSSIAKIIQSRAVLGEYQPHVGTHRNRNRKPDGDPIVDYYPRIINEETFWRAQNAAAGRRQSAAGRKGRTGAHIIQGLGRCATCNGAMHIQNKGALPKGGIWLACSSNLRKAGCENDRRVRVDRLERNLLVALLHVDVGALASLDDETPKMLRQVEALKAKLAAAEALRARLLALYVKTDNDEEVEKEVVKATLEAKELKVQLKAQEQAAASNQADPGTIARLATANELSGQLEEADLEKRRELRIKLSSLLRGLVERVECRPIGPVMVLKPRLEVRMNGEMPFAFRMEDGVVSMLLDTSATNEALDDFFLGLGRAPEMR